MRITIYGIKNCDTMKKVHAWPAARGVQCAFHDYAKALPRGRT
jgi:arsenate reductase